MSRSSQRIHADARRPPDSRWRPALHAEWSGAFRTRAGTAQAPLPFVFGSSHAVSYIEASLASNVPCFIGRILVR
jgi:hypothetical protein